MSFTKIGEALEFDPQSSIMTPKEALADDEIAKRFIKLAKKLKRISPKADGFLYFSAIMLHSAEAALVDQITGEPLKNAKGEPVRGWFEKFINKQGKESLRWVSPDGIKPYRNQNRDCFPHDQLKPAYRKWVGKGLFKDHQSDSVDSIRGLVIDAYYDDKFKRVVGLCALDKKNYGDLARKVEAGYANCVSMGTAVGVSCCSECGNLAYTEKDYCPCVKSRNHYAEFNLNLSPIELSLVTNGADGLAKVKRIIASMNEYVQTKTARIEQLKCDRCVNPAELQDLSDSMAEMQKRLGALMGAQTTKNAGEMGELAKMIATLQDQLKLETDPTKQADLKGKIDALIGKLNPTAETTTQPSQATVGGGEGYSAQNPETSVATPSWAFGPDQRFASTSNVIGDGNQGATKEIRLLRSRVESMMKSFEELKTNIHKEDTMNSARIKARAKARRAYWLGGGGLNDPENLPYPKEDAEKIRDKEDKQMVGEPLETGSEGLHPGDKEKLTEVNRDGLNLSKAELEERSMRRRAYFQGGGGVNEPTPGAVKYPKEDEDSIRAKEDKQMAEVRDMGGTDGMVPGDKEVKEKLLRAKLKAKFTKAASKADSKWEVYADDKLILSATGKDIYEENDKGKEGLDHNWDYLSSAEYGKDVMAAIRSQGLDKVAYLLKGAEGEVPAPAPAAPEAGGPVSIPAPDATPAPAPEAKPEEPKKDDMSEKVNAALSAMEEKISEIRDLLGGGKGKESGLAELDVSTEAPMDKVLASVEGLLDDAADELALISEAFDGKLDAAAKVKAVRLAGQALEDSQAIIAEANQAIESAKKCCGSVSAVDGTIKARANKRAALLAKAMEEMAAEAPVVDMSAKDKDGDKDEVAKLKEEIKALKEELKECKKDEEDVVEVEEEKEDDGKDGQCAHGPETTCDYCMPAVDMANTVEVKAGDTVKVVSTKKTREEIIAQAEAILGKYQLTLDKAETVTEPTFTQAHPKGGTTTELTGTKTPGAKVETIAEQHEVIQEIALSGPRNVREAAAELNEKIVEGKIKVEDLDRLVAEGKADAECVAYFKKFWAQAPGTGSFGSDLSKDFDGAKKKASVDEIKAKYRRAYDVGLVAQEKGFITPTREALNSYVDEIMKFDDAAFESNRRVMAGYKPRQQGGLPVITASAANTDIGASANEQPASMPDQLSVLWRQ